MAGCYELVGFNAPCFSNGIKDPQAENVSGFLQLNNDGCVHLPVNTEKQIEVEPGDVIGFYIDRLRNVGDAGGNPSDGRVRMIASDTVITYHKNVNNFGDLRSVYAIQPLGQTAATCRAAHGEDVAIGELSSSTNGAPLINLEFGMHKANYPSSSINQLSHCTTS